MVWPAIALKQIVEQNHNMHIFVSMRLTIRRNQENRRDLLIPPVTECKYCDAASVYIRRFGLPWPASYPRNKMISRVEETLTLRNKCK